MSINRILLARWLGLHAVGMAGIAVLVWLLAERLAQLWVFVLAGPIVGIGMGTLQSLSLRDLRPRLRGWAPATAIGVTLGFILAPFVAVGFTLLALTLDQWIDPIGSLMSPIAILYFTIGWFGTALLAGAIGATCLGIAQWFILRNHYEKSYQWIIGHVIGGGLMGPLLLIGILGLTGVANFMWGKVESGLLRGLMVTLVGGAGGVFLGILTGPWLIAILRYPRSRGAHDNQP